MVGIYAHLRAASQQCQLRGLFVASNWAAEQLLGCPETQESDGHEEMVNLFSVAEPVPAREVGLIHMATSLLTLGEYQRCAGLLLDASTSSLKVKSCLAVFLYVYAQYLAGEKLLSRNKKEINKASAESADDSAMKKFRPKMAVDSDSRRNCHLPFLYELLRTAFKEQSVDGFLLYIFAVITCKYYEQYGKPCDPAAQLDPYDLYKLAVARYPWNWSAWMDLAVLCLETHRAIPSVQDIQSLAAEDMDPEQIKLMHAFFITHVFLEKHRGDLALQVLKGLHGSFPTSLYLYTQIGVAYYTQRLHDRAQECFEYVRLHDSCRLQHIDTFSNILYVKEKAAELSLLAHEVMKVEKYSPEVCCVVGNYYSLKGQHEKAVLYFQRALALHADYLPAWTLMGHEYIELHNIANAIQCYRNALVIYKYDYRPWYGLGQTYEMLHLYQYAVHYFNKAANLRPFDARMWSAVGNCLLKLGMKYDAMMVLERAVKTGDREGIATRDLARLYRDEAEEDKAADLYYKYLQCNLFEEQGDEVHALPASLEELGSILRSNGGAEMVNNNRNYMDNTIDTEQAEALLYLALYFQSKADGSLTEFFCTRLLGFNGPEGDEARLIMKSLRSELAAGRLSLPTPSFTRPYEEPGSGHVNRFMLSASPHSRTDSAFSMPMQSQSTRRESAGSMMSLASGHFDPFERYLHTSGDHDMVEAELDLSASHLQDMDDAPDMSMLNRSLDVDISAIQSVPETAGFRRTRASANRM